MSEVIFPSSNPIIVSNANPSSMYCSVNLAKFKPHEQESWLNEIIQQIICSFKYKVKLSNT